MKSPVLPVCPPLSTPVPLYRYGPSHWEDLPTGISREWLLTNGLGGFACSTIIGANTRRYHGLLVASQAPPLDRQLLLSKVEEEIGQGETFHQLSTNQYRDSVFPAGYRFLSSYTQTFFPVWFYNVPGMTLKKWIFMKHGENTTVLGYELVHAAAPVQLYLRPLVTHRNYHHLLRSDSKKFDQKASLKSVELRSGNNGPFLHIASTGGTYYPAGQWYYNFQYLREKERGLDFEEDLFSPGSFAFTLSPGDTIYLIASSEPISRPEPLNWQKSEEERISNLSSRWSGANADLQRLSLASDAFITKKRDFSVMAGYPWLTDWGRDTLISIPGLFLVTGRFEDAKQLLETYSSRIKNGLLPNSCYELELAELKEINRQVRQELLKNGGSKPFEPNYVYRSVDTPLWLFYAVYKTFLYSKDEAFVHRMLPALESIIKAYLEGTLFSIRVEKDELLYAGEADTRLTWMDANVGHLVVTPRHGAPVEVNALWYNALKIMESFSSSTQKSFFADRAGKFLSAFRNKFWNSEAEALYDCLTPNGPDTTLRPNQILALSLPFPLTTKEQGEKVLQKISSHLYTPFGLRTLAPEDPNYKGTYQGDRWLRDRALHQGTAWPWLLGPYMTALVNVEGEKARPKVVDLLSPILAHLPDAGVGTISEIFWGDFPHEACGCIAKAWSVAEVLRAYVEDGLGMKP